MEQTISPVTCGSSRLRRYPARSMLTDGRLGRGAAGSCCATAQPRDRHRKRARGWKAELRSDHRRTLALTQIEARHSAGMSGVVCAKGDLVARFETKHGDGLARC
jgi:hypothetical protein